MFKTTIQILTVLLFFAAAMTDAQAQGNRNPTWKPQNQQRSKEPKLGIKHDDPNKDYKECYAECVLNSKTKQEQQRCMKRCDQRFTAKPSEPQFGPNLADYVACVSFCNNNLEGQAAVACIEGCSGLESEAASPNTKKK